MNERLEFFPVRLRYALANCRMKQRELATKLGVTRQTISLYSNGKMPPTLENAIAIAEALGVSLDWLFPSEITEEDRIIKAFLGRGSK